MATPTTLLPAGALGSQLRLDAVLAITGAPCPDDAAPFADGGCLQLAGSLVPGYLVLDQATAEEQPDGSWAVVLLFDPRSISLVTGLTIECANRTEDCPTGQLALLLDEGAHSAPVIVEPLSGDDPILLGGYNEVEAKTLARDLTASIGVVPDGVEVQPATDYTLGEVGGSAKDAAERLMGELLGDPSVTMGVEDRDGATFVSMETSTGTEVEATVVFDIGTQAHRVTGLVSPGVSGLITENGELFAELPEGGRLRVRGFTADFNGEIDATEPGGKRVSSGRSGPLPLPDDEYVWLILRLETDDGRVLWGFSRR